MIFTERTIATPQNEIAATEAARMHAVEILSMYEKPSRAEENTAKLLQAFYLPAQRVIDELQNRGYIVNRFAPDYMYHSDVQDHGGNRFSDKFSLSKVESRAIGTEVLIREYHIFGAEWLILDPEGGFIAQLRLFPRAAQGSSFTGVEYTIPDQANKTTLYSREVGKDTEATIFSVVESELNAVLGTLIASADLANEEALHTHQDQTTYAHHSSE